MVHSLPIIALAVFVFPTLSLNVQDRETRPMVEVTGSRYRKMTTSGGDVRNVPMHDDKSTKATAQMLTDRTNQCNTIGRSFGCGNTTHKPAVQ